MEAATSNYEITRNKTQETFASYDHEAIAEKLSLKMDECYVYLDFLGHPYRVDRKSGHMEWSSDDFQKLQEANFNEVLTIMDILCYSKPGAKAVGEFTLMQSLSAVQTANTYAGYGMFNKEEKYFDVHAGQLEEALRKMGGTPYGKGDISMKIPVYGELSVWFQFWMSDEEFPPALRLYCDKAMLDFMHYETIWYVASEIIARLHAFIEEMA